MKVDLHLHSEYSWDSEVKITEYVKKAEDHNFGAISITDHNSTESHEIIQKLQDTTDVILVPGQEISTEDGHLLVYGWSRDIPSNISMVETVEIARKQECICVAAHPYDLFRQGSRSKIFESKLDGIETLNASALLGIFNWWAKRSIINRDSVFGVGNSDSHRINEFGTAYSQIPESRGIEEVLDNLKEAKPMGKRIGVKNKLIRFLKRKF